MPFLSHNTELNWRSGRLATRDGSTVRRIVLVAGFLLVNHGVIAPWAAAQQPSTAAPSTLDAKPMDLDQNENATNPSFGTSVNPLDGRGAAASSNSLSAPTGISSEQIIDILQRNPDLVSELKLMAADRMQAQGAEMDPNDISDQ